MNLETIHTKQDKDWQKV